MKPNILFYGNCQLGALSHHIRQYSNFNILDCKDYELEPFWADSGLFAVWSLENQIKQKSIYKKVVQAVKDCDIFIFQDYKEFADRPIELTTKYLVDQNRSCLSICIPSFWYTGYLNTAANTHPIIYDLFINQKYSIDDILHFLENDTNDTIAGMIVDEHTKSITELQNRQTKESNEYTNFISIVNFIETYFDKKILAYTHSHPSTHYYNFIVSELNKQYNLNIKEQFTNKSLLPGANNNIQYSDLYFFKHYFANIIDDLYYHNTFFTTKLNIDTIKKQIALINK